MKIFLCCAAGMSTSMLVDRMMTAATEQGIEDCKIEAFSMTDFPNQIESNDVCLVAPQAKYRFEEFKEKADELGKGCALIPMMDYGMMNGAAVLKLGVDTYNAIKGE